MVTPHASACVAAKKGPQPSLPAPTNSFQTPARTSVTNARARTVAHPHLPGLIAGESTHHCNLSRPSQRPAQKPYPSDRPLLLAGFDDLGVCLHQRLLVHVLVGIQTLARLRVITSHHVESRHVTSRHVRAARGRVRRCYSKDRQHGFMDIHIVFAYILREVVYIRW